ncbi:hypothetical protein [Parathermosynechococcus lividus]
MAGLQYSKELIQTIFREGMMRESVIYQESLQEGEQIGLQRGRREEAYALTVRQLTQRVRLEQNSTFVVFMLSELSK